jgi:hypothetical protein
MLGQHLAHGLWGLAWPSNRNSAAMLGASAQVLAELQWGVGEAPSKVKPTGTHQMQPATARWAEEASVVGNTGGEVPPVGAEGK